MLININKNNFVINEFVEDKEIYSTKIVEKLPADASDYFYKYIDGQLVRDSIIEQKTFEGAKKIKYAELETYINDLKNIGTEIDGKWFKCDDEAKNNLTQCMVGIDFMLPITWFTRNGQQGIVSFDTKESFMQFALQLAAKLAELQNKYYTYKYQIDNAQSKEELNQIVFEKKEI